MFNTTNTQHSGQSFTLDVKEQGGKTLVSCPSVPDVGTIEDTDQRFAIQQMRRRLDDHVHRGYQNDRRTLIVGPNPDAD